MNPPDQNPMTKVSENWFNWFARKTQDKTLGETELLMAASLAAGPPPIFMLPPKDAK